MQMRAKLVEFSSNFRYAGFNSVHCILCKVLSQQFLQTIPDSDARCDTFRTGKTCMYVCARDCLCVCASVSVCLHFQGLSDNKKASVCSALSYDDLTTFFKSFTSNLSLSLVSTHRRDLKTHILLSLTPGLQQCAPFKLTSAEKGGSG